MNRWRAAVQAVAIEHWQIAAIGIVLALQFSLVFTRAINWDEFYYFAEVQRFADGQLDRGMQTIHTRLFEWLTLLPGNAVDKIVAGRVFMFGFQFVTVVSIAVIARRFASREIALCCALAYLSAGFVMQHGFSFRTDPTATALLMSALAILARSRMNVWSIAAFGLLAGWSIMVTIKVALYLPAFAGIAWLRWRDAGWTWMMAARIAVAAALAIAVFAITYLLHSAQIAETAGHQGTGQVIASSGRKMFFIGIPPYWSMAVRAALFAIPLTVAILLVPGRLFENSRPAAERVALAGLFAPLLTLLFFHNTAPYFYAFMLAPVVVACAATLPLLIARYRIEGVTLALLLNACLTWAVDGESRIDKQRTILTAAQQMFPAGTAYFDLCYMLPNFAKKNGFMTPWGTELYLTAGYPTFARAMDQQPVPLIVENDPMFTNLLRSDAPTPEFLPEDTAAMRGSYLPFWGPLWLAGQELQPKEIRTAMIRVPGPYTVTGGTVTIDGVRYLDRDVVALDRGETQMIAGSQPVTLWWGENRERPSVTPPEGMFWTGF